MSAKYQVQLWSVAIFSVVIMAPTAPTARAALVTWIGGNVDWVDGGAAANWTPADEPDNDDDAIFNTGNTVNLGSNNIINSLALLGGIDLNTNDFDLTVSGLVQLGGANTNLIVGAAASTLSAHNVSINNLADVDMAGGVLGVGGVPAAGFGVLDINAGGELVGHGTVNLTEALGGGTETLLVNDGTISASRASLVIFGEPQVGTLSINFTDNFAQMDLDGTGENGVLNVFRNQTLDVNNFNPPETFDGDINLFHDTTLDIASAWTLATGTIDVDNGFINGVFPNPDVPAGVSIIDGGTLTQTGGIITVVDADGTLRFNTGFTMNGGTFTNNGLVIFDGNATLAAAANFTMPTTTSSLAVAANRTVNVNQTNFNLDGANAATNVITVNADATLTINTTDYDPDSATNAFDGTVNLSSGTISVNVSDAEFVMDGVLNSSASGSDQSLWTGDALDIGNDVGALDADVNISGTQPTQFGSQVDFNSDADLDVADGATAHFLQAVNFNSVNGGGNAQFTGAGELIFSAGVNFNEATTLNMAGGTVDLDGADSIGDTINVDAPLVINAELMRSFGKNNGGGGTNLLDVNNSVGLGVLTVNLDNAADEWTLNAQGVMNLVNDNAEATLLAGSDVNINGTVNVTGDVRTTARLDIAGVVNINTAAEPLRLAGGDNINDPNTLAGGTISGVGLLGADTGKELRGFGAINTGVDFDGASNLFADDGTLTINGAIVDVARIGTFDADGVLNVVNPWNTAVASFVTLEGGTIQGGTMTINNGNGVSGEGLITARLVNNVRLRSSDGTLVVETSGNDNDWDGAAGGGVLAAINVGTLELRDVGAAFGFTGTVEASTSSRVFTNGFALDFNPGSTLNLTSSTYESTSSTDIGGTVTVGVGADSTIEVENNFFLTFENGSSTTLNADLQLLNNNIIIEQGAAFSGTGALVVPDGSNVVGEANANIGVLLDMQGGFRPGNSEGIGRVDLFDYQQANTGKLFVEIKGTALNAFDRLVASGDVVLDGFLSIDIDEIAPMVPFVPVLGQTFNIITANSVTGTFDTVDVSGMPAGLAFHLNYLANAVQLQVVNKPIFSADFDEDGDVDSTDLTIWRNAFDLNQLGDADGDNDSDGNDFLLWQRQLGSAPTVAAVAAVPEPAGAMLSLVAAVALACAGFRRVRFGCG